MSGDTEGPSDMDLRAARRGLVSVEDGFIEDLGYAPRWVEAARWAVRQQLEEGDHA